MSVSTPVVVGHSPAIGPGVRLQVTLNGSVLIDPGSVYFTLKERDADVSVVGQVYTNGVVPGTHQQEIIFIPVEPLKPGVFYRASCQVFSTSGTSLPVPYMWDFGVDNKINLGA